MISKINPEEVLIVASKHRTIIGITGLDWFSTGAYMALLFTGYTSVPVEVQSTFKLESLEDYHDILNNMKRRRKETTQGILRCLSKANEVLERVKDLQSLKVVKTKKTALYYVEKHKYQKKIIENHKNFRYPKDVTLNKLVVHENKVIIPTSAEPFFYNSHCDLLPFEIGDVVELTFQDHRLVNKKYRGKKVKFVVNNFLEYSYRNKTKRLALTPTTDKWTLNDVIILDDTDRFDCLMIDLFPCNRRPYAGYYNKQVTIDKVGEIKDLPHYKDNFNLDELLNRSKDDYTLNYYLDNNTDKVRYTYVGKGPVFFNHKIVTSADVKSGISLLEDELASINKQIKSMTAHLDETDKHLKGYKDFKYEDILKAQLGLT